MAYVEMIVPVTKLRKFAKISAIVGVFAASTPLSAQLVNQEPTVEDVAMTPLQDLNLAGDEVPPVLVDAVRDPYASEKLATCNDIVMEIARIDTVLGNDYDLAGQEETGLTEGKVAKGIVATLIPFRGVLREVTGAADDTREMKAAVTAGMVRRGFLKGLGQSKGCEYPARPRAEPLASEE